MSLPSPILFRKSVWDSTDGSLSFGHSLLQAEVLDVFATDSGDKFLTDDIAKPGNKTWFLLLVKCNVPGSSPGTHFFFAYDREDAYYVAMDKPWGVRTRLKSGRGVSKEDWDAGRGEARFDELPFISPFNAQDKSQLESAVSLYLGEKDRPWFATH